MGLKFFGWSKDFLAAKQSWLMSEEIPQDIQLEEVKSNDVNGKLPRFCREDGIPLVEYQGQAHNGLHAIYAVCPKRNDFNTNYNLHTFEYVRKIPASTTAKYNEITGKKL